MPKLWNDTIAEHRQQVRDAILDTTWSLVTEHGLLSVTMSRIAEETGIGRATLYKYFPDVESILHAWHQHHVAAHLDHLAALADHSGDQSADHSADVRERLESVLGAYALICHRRGRHGSELAVLLHRGEHVDQAQQHVRTMLRDLLAEAATAGLVRDDVAPDELAVYCVHALSACGGLPSEDAVSRLVAVTLAGLRPA
ncbi:MAG: TetR family transcriptional regulator [Actinophytocola sp.]|nr:TetR family transcriptional regulator [Actinophytocola sp.]